MSAETSSYDVTDDAALDAIVSALRSGEPVVFPTDTVYGLAALPSVPGAVDRLFELKDRPGDRSIAVLVADLAQASAVGHFGEVEQRWAGEHWPGALTIVVRRHDEVTNIGTADGTIGIRCPDDDFVRAVAAQAGPLATTSANLSGQPTPTTATLAASGLTGPVAVVVDGGIRDGVASTVARSTPDGPEVFRQGAVTL